MQHLKLLLSVLFLLPFSNNPQTNEAERLLEKSIAYHDPNQVWNSFEGSMEINMTIPDKGVRNTKIELNFPKRYFKSTVTQDDQVIVSQWDKGDCAFWFNGSQEYAPEVASEYRLNCERTSRMKNYYTYLYGLPMKLKDPGTKLHPDVKKVEWRGETYLRLQVDYDPQIGKDRWYFYLDQDTAQLKHYQFFHDESKNDGEYILLSEEMEIQGMKIPKRRVWYTNKQDRYLGTDDLISGF